MKVKRLINKLFLLFLCAGCGQQAPPPPSSSNASIGVATEANESAAIPVSTTTSPVGKEEIFDEIARFNETKARAEQGDAASQTRLGIAYDKGDGVAKDSVEALKWFRKAAEQNNTAAQNSLGVYYSTGIGVPKDELEALKWFRRAAEQNDAQAQYNLGQIYHAGIGVPKDELEAVKWFRKAAEQNDTSAQNNLGACYATGIGVAKDEVEAVKWYRKAAEQNDAQAQHNLGVCYERGGGVVKDQVEAVKWYRRAAEQNHAEAQYNLGSRFYHGNGVPFDSVEAYKWFELVLAKAKPADFMECSTLISKPARVPLVTINGITIEPGQSAFVRTPRGTIKIKCLSIENAKAEVLVEGETETRTIGLGLKNVFQAVFEMRSALEELMTRNQVAEAKMLADEYKRKTESAYPRETQNPWDPFDHVGEPTASGTGFFISEDGFLITNQHVVRDAAQVRLVTSAGLISAKVVKVDAANDLALLKAEGRFAALPVAASRTVKLGGTVATVGFPNIGLQGFAPKLAKGEIASLSGAEDDARYFQISVPVQPGNSGGALVDERGNVVGVVSAKLSALAALAASGALPENVNYAVKSSYLLSFLESVREVSAKLKEPRTADRKFEEVVKDAEQAAVLVLVY